MGKITDALIKAALLKDKTSQQTSGDRPAAVAPKAAPEKTPTPPVKTPAPAGVPTLRLVTEPPRTSRTSPVPKEDFQPVEQPRRKMTSLIFPSIAPAAPTHEEPAEERPVLPEVEPTPDEANRVYLSVHAGADDRSAAEFRRLKGRLAAGAASARVILVAGPKPAEGKTALAVNLAISFADTYGEKVVLLDANLTRPKIGEVLEQSGEGLRGIVRGRISAEDAITKTAIAGLWTVCAGRGDDRSEGLLSSKSVAKLLRQLRQRFTRIIVELPADSDVPDALSIVTQSDLLLVPVMRSRTRRGGLKHFLQKATDLGAPRVECVFIDA